MTELKYLRDEAREDYINIQLNKYPKLKEMITNEIKKAVGKGNKDCLIDFKNSNEREFAEVILQNSGYDYYCDCEITLRVLWY